MVYFRQYVTCVNGGLLFLKEIHCVNIILGSVLDFSLTVFDGLTHVASFFSLDPLLMKVTCEGYVFTGVCLSTGGCLPHTPHPPRTRGRHHLDRHPPGQTSPNRHSWANTPQEDNPPCETPLWAYTPSGQTTPEQTPPEQTPPEADTLLNRHPLVPSVCWETVNKRYTSHWNAFLFYSSLFRSDCVKMPVWPVSHENT